MKKLKLGNVGCRMSDVGCDGSPDRPSVRESQAASRKSILVATAFILAAFDASTAAEPVADEEIRLFDRIVYTGKNGDTITVDGTIIEENPSQITIKSRVATYPIEVSSIQGEIKRRRPPEAVYKELAAKLRAARTDPERASLNLKIGLFCVRPNPALGGDAPLSDPAIGPSKAFAHLYKAVQINPRNVQAYPWLLDLLAAAREARGGRKPKPSELEEEVDVYMLARAGGFEHPEIDFRMAEILKDQLGRSSEAVKLYRKVFSGGTGADGQPVNRSLVRSARRSLASIHLARGEMDQALGLFAGPSGGAGDAADFEALYQAALLHFERATPQDRVDARALFARAQTLQPDFPGIARYLAALDYADGKLAPAQSALLRLADGGADDAGLKVDLAIVEIQAGKFSRALKRLNAVLGDVPSAGAPPPPPPDQAGAGGATAEAVPVLPAALDGGDHAASGAPAGSVEGGPVDPERARAYLARGLIFDARGNDPVARGEYRRALAADPGSAMAALLSAEADLRAGDRATARATLTALIKDNAGKRGLFAAYARVMADVEIADGQPRKALNLLEYAIGIDPADPLLRRKIGTLLLSMGEMDRAAVHLEAAQKVLSRDPALLNALGYWKYVRGEFEEAEKQYFKKAQGLVPLIEAKPDKPPPPVPPLRRYAETGIQYAQDAQGLEVWTDDFNRKDGDEVAMNWLTQQSYGITPGIHDGKLVFSGQQTNDPNGVTWVVRNEDAQNVERLSVKLRFDGQSGRSRAGIRMETVPPSAGLVFFRDFDGRMGFARKTTKSDWEDGAPPADTKKDKLVFPGDVKWPEGDGFHTLLIRRTAGVGSSSSTAFDLYLDGRPVAQNVQVDGLRAKSYQVGVSGKAEKLGDAYRFEADDFRLYRPRQVRAQEKRQ